MPLAASPMEGLSFVQLKVVPLIAPAKFTAAVLAPLQSVCPVGCTTFGVGLTVMVKFCAGPGQPFAVGVTVMVAVTGTLVVLIAVNAGMFPLPLAARPMEGLSFVQLNAVPATLPVKLVAAVLAALQITWFAGCTTLGVGFTVIVKLCAGPLHPLAKGSTTMPATTTAFVLLIAVKEGISPVPFAAKPIAGLLFIQLKLLAATGPEKLMVAVLAPLHKAWLAG